MTGTQLGGPADRLTDRMVFLVGAPRSGTNWVQRILAAHPDVVALPSETHLFSHGLRHLDEQVQSGLLASPSTGTVYLPRAEWVAAMREFCVLVYDRIARALGPDARLIVERSPHHVEHLELIAEVFPDARVVHVVRDGRDVARSLARQEWGPGDVGAAARQWAGQIRSAHAAAPRLRSFVEVRYEDLHADPRRGIERLYAALDLPADEATLAAAVAEASAWYNVDPGSQQVGSGKWRGEWSARELADFVAAAGEVLHDLGYDDQPLAPRAERGVRSTLAEFRRRRPRRRRALPHSSGPVVTEMEAAQRLVDRFLAAAADGRLLDQLAESVSISCLTAEGGWSGRGAPAADRLRGVLAAEGPWGRQVRASEQVVNGAFVVTIVNEASDGRTTARTVTLSPAADGKLRHVGYTSFPLAD